MTDILSRNRSKLLTFVESLDLGKGSGDEQTFQEAKRQVLRSLLDLTPAHSASGSLVVEN